MRATLTLFLLIITLASRAQAADCPRPGDVIFPLGEVIEKAGLSLEFDFTDKTYPPYGSPEHVAQIRRHVLANLEGKSQAERDAMMLGRLSWSTIGTIPLLGITVFTDAGQFDDYLDVLTRHDLTQHATALHLVKSSFPNWHRSAADRYKQWNDPDGGINPVLDHVLRTQSAAFKAAQPPLLKAAENILKTDPSYDSYLAQREGADDWRKHTHLMSEIGACLARYATPSEADAALSEIDPLLADFHVVDMFLLEALNGGMHQYIYNSTGMMAPQLADIMTRWELPEQAKAVQDTMALFPTPYPRDTQKRREIMLKFDEPTDDAANAATWISDDPEIWEAVKTRAMEAGYWPR